MFEARPFRGAILIAALGLSLALVAPAWGQEVADPNPPTLTLYGVNDEEGWDGYYHDSFFITGVTPNNNIYPPEGTIDTIFEFLIEYEDAGGDAPRFDPCG